MKLSKQWHCFVAKIKTVVYVVFSLQPSILDAKGFVCRVWLNANVYFNVQYSWKTVAGKFLFHVKEMQLHPFMLSNL